MDANEDNQKLLKWKEMHRFIGISYSICQIIEFVILFLKKDHLVATEEFWR